MTNAPIDLCSAYFFIFFSSGKHLHLGNKRHSQETRNSRSSYIVATIVGTIGAYYSYLILIRIQSTEAG